MAKLPNRIRPALKIMRALNLRAGVSTAACVSHQIGNHVDYYVRQHDYNYTNKRVNSSTFAFFCRFFVAGRGNVLEAAQNKEQYGNTEGNAEQPINNSPNKAVNAGARVTVKSGGRVALEAPIQLAMGHQMRSEQQKAH